MKITLQSLTVTLITLIALLGVHDTAMARSVYHTVKAGKVGETYIVNWSADSFGVSGNPDATLSFLEFGSDEEAINDAKEKAAAANAKPENYACQVKVELQDLPPGHLVKGATAKIGKDAFNVAGTYPKAEPTPWTITYDHVGSDKHWGLDIKDFTKDVASKTDAGKISALTLLILTERENQGVSIINGNESNCTAH
ncbi:hypothetical protein [Rhizobium sp.]|jgi:hypothetical protein|uniref:hypothetical protein n=1 Tax=Rhizobium sp. TaxID=391 RepID=UPI000E8A33CE|nr:hypothetical protein [Rhizobium sp.]